MLALKAFMVVFLVLHRSVYSAEKLTLHVLYETLCPDSVAYISDQLYPAWKELGRYLNVVFVPFGKSASLGDGSFVCQHGPKECLGNRLQSCTLKELPSQDAQVEYVRCFMASYNNNPEEYGQSCAVNAGANWDSVVQCYNSNLGTQLQLNEERITAQIQPKSIPTTLFNGQFDQLLQDESLKNLRGVIRGLISRTYPQAGSS